MVLPTKGEKMNFVILARKPYQSDHECDYLGTYEKVGQALAEQIMFALQFGKSNPEGYAAIHVVMEDGSSSGLDQIIL